MSSAKKRREGEQDPLQWHCEPRWCVDAMLSHVSLGNTLVYDPCCGRGNILDAAESAGHATIGSDIVDRGARKRHTFAQGNFLQMKKPPNTRGRSLSLVMNPPYKEQGEQFVRHALSLPYRHALFIFPLSWLASEGRYHLFTRDCPPTQLLFHSERPSMPPGRDIDSPSAFKNGSIDYFWLRYERGARAQPPDWIRPRAFA